MSSAQTKPSTEDLTHSTRTDPANIQNSISSPSCFHLFRTSDIPGSFNEKENASYENEPGSNLIKLRLIATGKELIVPNRRKLSFRFRIGLRKRKH